MKLERFSGLAVCGFWGLCLWGLRILGDMVKLSGNYISKGCVIIGWVDVDPNVTLRRRWSFVDEYVYLVQNRQGIR